jgi:glycogen debranching enzyme
MEDELIQIEGQPYVRADSVRTVERMRVLKHDDTFGVFDSLGDVSHIVGLGSQGVFHCGTRYLSRFELRLGKVRPLLLSSTVNDANEILTVDLTNPDTPGPDGQVQLRSGLLHIMRVRFICRGACYERISLTNYGLTTMPVSLSVLFDADYADIFEVRGAKRARRGDMLDPRMGPDWCELGYRGLDRVTRRTMLRFTPRPDALAAGGARFEVPLEARKTAHIEVVVSCEPEVPVQVQCPARVDALASMNQSVRAAVGRQAALESDNPPLNDWVRRSVVDLHMMTTQTTTGLYPYAGVPWFSTVFGRDGIITAFQLLWSDPMVARGVLRYLAANQATDDNAQQDAEPGKILHETRAGEMSALGEVPFGRYYGSVDSTPLFIMLAGAYFARTGDRETLEALWPHIERALGWIDTHGDRDGDGFVEYAKRGASGLVHQGWKDSQDSVFHADGVLAEAPIALAEVQGYVYGARLATAAMGASLGMPEVVQRQSERAERLRVAFEQAFWCEDLGTYALALDGKKQPCRVRSSNAGQCLWTGIASPERARRVADGLLSPTGSTGWGIRTLDSSEVRYNPISYHNGSIWPHDNALIAAGFRRYGFVDAALRTFSALFGAATLLELHRLPELYCGFEQRAGVGPTLYPVACLPQAWASGSIFMLLQACLGLEISAERREVRFTSPALPPAIGELVLRNVAIGAATIDLRLQRHAHDHVGVTVLRREGDIRAVVTM